MEIKLITVNHKGRWGGGPETHIVSVDGNTVVRQSDNIEPEDVRFYRDLESPFFVEKLIKDVIQAVKRGEEVAIKYEVITEE